MRDYKQKILYVCPPLQYVKSLTQGILELNRKNSSTKTIRKAAMVSFGHVYIHAFEDGNGRINAFLIHDILILDHIIPNGTILPAFVQILAHIDKYDTSIELLSKLIELKVKYDLNDSGKMFATNASEIEAAYQFPDITNHTVFLAISTHVKGTKDITEELHFLQCYDEHKSDIQNIIDMPDNKVDRMILFLHQN